MSGKLSTLAAASLLIAMNAGCQGPNVVRGQNPSGPAEPWSAVQTAGFGKDSIYHKELVAPDAVAPVAGCPGGCNGGCYDGSCGYGGCGCESGAYGGCTCGGAAYGACVCGGAGYGGNRCGCGGKGCGKCCYDGKFPLHYNSYGYKPPQCLVYPNPQQPAGVVQYPYYTVKGPSDFFLQ